MNTRIVNILWERIVFNFDKFKELSKDSDFGFYQIYGQHPAYIGETLLYIGKTETKFSDRLNDRWEFIESCAYPTYVHLGRIVELKKDVNFCASIIEKIEVLLIRVHTPSFNKQHNTGLFSKRN